MTTIYLNATKVVDRFDFNVKLVKSLDNSFALFLNVLNNMDWVGGALRFEEGDTSKNSPVYNALVNDLEVDFYRLLKNPTEFIRVTENGSLEQMDKARARFNYEKYERKTY
jgi:hypothetical protein